MALSFPYPLAFLSDLLCTRDGVVVDLRRNDEASGTGDGRIYSAQMSAPIWQVSLSFDVKLREIAREIDAKIRALDGSRQAFLWADKFYRPASGTPPGALATVSSVSADRRLISLAGVRVGHRFSPGDRISITWGAGREYLGEIAEAATVGGAGSVSNLSVTPWIPHGVLSGSAVELVQPRLKVFIPPGGHVPFTALPGRWSRGGSLTLLQRI